MSVFHSFVPKESVNLLQKWKNELDIDIVISTPRRTKLGDFKVQKKKLVISINNDLNKYSFLITLTHELAHAFVYKQYSNKVLPHGKEWKKTFKSMLINFLPIFPEDIAKVLGKHLINPKASTFTDVNLSAVLRRYNSKTGLTISDLEEGTHFKISSGKEFVKGERIRKRFSCVELSSNKKYSFHPLAEVIVKQ